MHGRGEKLALTPMRQTSICSPSLATIVLGVWLYLASALGDGSTTRRNLLPYQTLIQNRPSAEQRVFRELQEGLLEARVGHAGDQQRIGARREVDDV